MRSRIPSEIAARKWTTPATEMIQRQSDQYSHLAALDGFRACLALWVYTGHLAKAVGYSNKLLALHPLAVDLFMVLSGFLMVHTWKGRHGYDHPLGKTAIKFYLARLFRIAPLYFVLLGVCFFLANPLALMKDQIETIFPPPWITDTTNYHPLTSWVVTSWQWWATHLSFVFGAIPGLQSSTPLPDWSLSLEMQFYVLFPLVLLTFRTKNLQIALVVISVAMAILSPRLLGNYLDAGSWAHFGQPSFLTYRLNAFVAGMLAANWLRHHIQTNNSITKTSVFYILLGLVCIAPLTKPVILLYGLFFILISAAQPKLNRWLSGRSLHFLGEISYSIYLAHIFVVTLVVSLLIRSDEFLSFAPELRFFFALAATLPVVLALSYLLYRSVEKPGITLGRALNKRLN